MVYNANQDKSVNQRQDMEQLRKELKRWEGEGKIKKVDIGDADEYQVGGRVLDGSSASLNKPRSAATQGRIR